MKHFSVAIDGPTGSGKSTVAKIISKKMDIKYLDTGATFRSITYKVIKEGLNPKNKNDVLSILKDLNFRVEYNYSDQINYLDEENVNDKIRTFEVGSNVAYIGSIPEVRLKLLEIWRIIAYDNDIIMDGRDIGTFVLPNASVKIYINASLDERTNRRFKELLSKGQNVTYDQVKNEIYNVDYINETREFSPAVMADDAVLIDSTNLTLDQVVKKSQKIILEAKLEENK